LSDGLDTLNVLKSTPQRLSTYMGEVFSHRELSLQMNSPLLSKEIVIRDVSEDPVP
jgi:hypothetical protein